MSFFVNLPEEWTVPQPIKINIKKLFYSKIRSELDLLNFIVTVPAQIMPRFRKCTRNH